MTILGLQFSTHRLGDLKAFYVETLRLPLVEERDDAFAVQAGQTKLVFERAEPETEPAYYFNVHMPVEEFVETMSRLGERVPLYNPNESGEAAPNGPALYCADPVQNVIAFTPREADNAPPETPNPLHIQRVGAVALVVDEVEEMQRMLQARLDFSRQPDAPGGRVVVGSADTAFILVPRGETVLPSAGPALDVHPIVMTLAGNLNAVDKLDQYPYYLHIADIADSGNFIGTRIEVRPV